MKYLLNNKYLCKKSLAGLDSEIYEGRYYEISRIANNHVMMSSDAGFEILYKEKGNSPVHYNFTDYFYSEKDIRKKKLNNLIYGTSNQ